ncbi:NADH-quinone oxidoreductase subunit NuoK [Acidihalobacter ferrooxydans]|uniref:NADH-quinone oxidoreductase subunit K n=1 Tax=Acidihalobacter ferrooxydans TaxID=1765967 RepID=A0A1P8UKB6_9GAMM|nr:NADH-quinone oxidoreductase subunit NuoK [Acidihalobacter ferrooxydans]APZ44277.1 NADH-quinone oxidoreductase subunit K [Acidihalobacter ferrooxydans]
MEYAPTLLAGGALFVIGLAMVLLRSELLFVLMGIEVMFNGAGLTAAAAGQYWHDPVGQVLVLFLMTITGAELAVALVLVYLAYRRLHATDLADVSMLRDDAADGEGAQ